MDGPMERIEAELLTDSGNDAVVRMPGRRFPGVLVQGGTLHILRSEVAEVVDACERGDLDEAQEATGLLSGELGCSADAVRGCVGRARDSPAALNCWAISLGSCGHRGPVVGVDLLGRQVRHLCGLDCFHRDSTLFPARSGALVVRSLSAWGRHYEPARLQVPHRCCLAALTSRLMSSRVRTLASSSSVLLAVLDSVVMSASTFSAAWLSVSSSVSICARNSVSWALERRS